VLCAARFSEAPVAEDVQEAIDNEWKDLEGIICGWTDEEVQAVVKGAVQLLTDQTADEVYSRQKSMPWW
jgi:hypothetical protein